MSSPPVNGFNILFDKVEGKEFVVSFTVASNGEKIAGNDWMDGICIDGAPHKQYGIYSTTARKVSSTQNRLPCYYEYKLQMGTEQETVGKLIKTTN